MSTKTNFSRPLPHQTDNIYLTDGGLETFLVFQKGIDLPAFASIALMRDEDGRQALRDYFEPYVAIARTAGQGLILESQTWRASNGWRADVGFGDDDALSKANAASIALLDDVRNTYETAMTPMLISGCIGPHGDGYDPGNVMSADEYEAYHAWQIAILAKAGADLISALTMTNTSEAIGIARAASNAGIPIAISFTLETDGKLPTGQPLHEAIAEVDTQTKSAPAYYMINCAHPEHIARALTSGGSWRDRLRGIRANASRLSHAELDESTVLDDGNPVELGMQLADLRVVLPKLNVIGGCCGTDHRHIAEAARSCTMARTASANAA